MNKLWLCLGGLFLVACTSERVVLLPSPDGKPGAVVVRDASGERLLDRPYAASVRQLGAVRTYQSNAQDVQERYGATLAAMPPRPVSYVLYFVSGADQLAEESVDELDAIRRVLNERPSAELLVIGHTDTVGSRESNDELSRQRAASVRDMLIEAGFPAEKMEIAGRGEREPLVPTADEVEEPRNRRVEINIR